MITLDVYHWPETSFDLKDVMHIANGPISDDTAFCLFETLIKRHLGHWQGGRVYLVEQNRIVLGQLGRPNRDMVDMWKREGVVFTDWPDYFGGHDRVLCTLTHHPDGPLHGVGRNMFMLLRVRCRTIKFLPVMSDAVFSDEARMIIFGENA